jgi:hypothetical protein
MTIVTETTMSELKYVVGDATQPVGKGNKLIIHCCNDVGAWGAGFVIALEKRWPAVKKAYLDWFEFNKDSDTLLWGRKKGLGQYTGDFALGKIQVVKVERNIWVANMIGQRSVASADGSPPIRYEAIEQALIRVSKFALNKFPAPNPKITNISVHAPRFGAGLAGGDWNEIEHMLNDRLVGYGVDVTIYDFEP